MNIFLINIKLDQIVKYGFLPNPPIWDSSSIWLSSTLFIALSEKLGRGSVVQVFYKRNGYSFLCLDPFITEETMLSSSENKKGPEGERGWGQASNLKLHRDQACTLPLGYTQAPNHNFAVVLCIGCWQWSSRGLLFIHFWLLSTCHTVGIILGSENSSPGLSLTELASEENGSMCVVLRRIPSDCIVLLLFMDFSIC